MKKYFSPSALISHQGRAKSAEYPKKPRARRNFFKNNFGKIVFRCDTFEDFYSRKNTFPPAGHISHQERAKSAEYPKKPRGRRNLKKKLFWKNSFQM